MNYELDGQMIMAIMPPKPEVSVRVVAQPDVEQLEMLEMEIEALNAELDDERSMARAQQMKCDKHLRDLKAAELELSNCRKGLDRSMQEVENARAEMKRKAHEQASTEEQLQRSKLLLEQSTRERSLGREVRTQDESEETIEELLATLEQREKELAEFQRRYEHFNNLHEEYKLAATNQVEELTEGFREQQADYIIKLEKAEKEMRSLRASAAREKKEASELRRHIRGTAQEKGGKNDEIKNLEQHLAARDLKIDKLTRDVEALQIKAKKVPGLASQLARLEADTTNLQNQNKRLQESADAMKASVNDEKIVAARMVSEVQAKNTELLKQMSTQRAALEEERRKYAKSLADLEAKNTDLRREVEVKEKKIDALEAENRKCAGRISTLNDGHLDLKRQLSKAVKARKEIDLEDDAHSKWVKGE